MADNRLNLWKNFEWDGRNVAVFFNRLVLCWCFFFCSLALYCILNNTNDFINTYITIRFQMIIINLNTFFIIFHFSSQQISVYSSYMAVPYSFDWLMDCGIGHCVCEYCVYMCLEDTHRMHTRTYWPGRKLNNLEKQDYRQNITMHI